MLRSTIPQGDSGTPGTVGGLPAIDCAAATAGTYTLPLVGGWNGDAFAYLGTYIKIGCDAADVTPAPSFPLTVNYQVALPLSPVAGVPTGEDVPASFQLVDDGTANPIISTGELAAVLPVAALVPLLGANNDFWLRLETTDANGCKGHVDAYFPNGISEHPSAGSDPTLIYIIADGVTTTMLIDLPPTDDDPGPVTAVHNVVATTVCPAPQRMVAVGQPDCADPFRVTVVDVPGSGGTHIAGQVDGDQGDDIRVTLGGEVVQVATPAAATVQLHAEIEYGTSTVIGDAPVDVTIPAGAEAVFIYFGGDASDVNCIAYARISDHGMGTFLAPRSGTEFPMLHFTAPAGRSFPEVTASVRAGSAPMTVRVTGLYPPS